MGSLIKANIVLVGLLLVGCTADEKGLESPAPVFAGADSFEQPTEHGTLSFPVEIAARIDADERVHSFHFELSAAATVTLESNSAEGSSVDTVFYLYRAGEAGWGGYIAKDDDGGQDYFSRLNEDLGAGSYRLIVKGYSDADNGAFILEANCSGDGCMTAPSDTCLFGDSYYDYTNSPNFDLLTEQILDKDSELTTTVANQIVAAFASYGEPISRADDSFDMVDYGQLNYAVRMNALDDRRFESIEFGAGDNGFGAIFFGGTADIAASIVDGDLADCQVAEPSLRRTPRQGSGS